MMTPLPRRRLLKAIVSAPIVLSVPAQLACSLFDRSQTIASRQTSFGVLLSFDEQQAGLLSAFAEACLNVDAGLVKEAQVLGRLDEELFFVEASIRDDFHLALRVLEYLPLAYGEFSRFSKLSQVEALEFIESISETRSDTVRAVVHSLRMAVMLTYYGHQSTWQDIHYDGSHGKLPVQKSAQRRRYERLVSQHSESQGAAR